MSSPFSSALAKLDDSLQTIQTQIERLGRGLNADEDQLFRALADTCRYATVLSDLISVQLPNVNGVDREALDRLIYELKALGRSQRRRVKLLNLAMELDAGRVHHHRVNRTQALNELRLDAVRELRELISRPAQDKDIPGPGVSKWLNWACNLHEDEHAEVLRSLRRDFPEVEDFIAAMDVGYWVPGERQAMDLSSEIAEEAPEEAVDDAAPKPSAQPLDPALADQDGLAQNVIALFEKVLYIGGKEAGFPLQGHPRSETPSVPEDSAASTSDSAGQTTAVLPSGGQNGDEWERSATERSTALLRPSRFERERINKAATAEFLKVMGAWQLRDWQARRLLGVSRALFNQLREGQNVILEPDKLARISLLVAIWKGLNVLYGSRRGDRWIHRPNSNPLFSRQSPLKYMIQKGVEGLISVRELVGVWAAYVPPEESK